MNILVVDKNVVCGKLISESLQQRGVTSDSVSDWNVARRRIKSTPYDCILVDAFSACERGEDFLAEQPQDRVFWLYPKYMVPGWILSVEDNDDDAAMMTVGFKDAGFDIQTARNGADALAMLESNIPQVIFLDLGLPGMNGFEVIKSIRDKGLKVPVVVVTARSGEFSKEDAFKLGADAYLIKPISLEKLINTMRAFLVPRTTDLPKPSSLAEFSLFADDVCKKMEMFEPLP